jgi:hypothetical protein
MVWGSTDIVPGNANLALLEVAKAAPVDITMTITARDSAGVLFDFTAASGVVVSVDRNPNDTYLSNCNTANGSAITGTASALTFTITIAQLSSLLALIGARTGSVFFYVTDGVTSLLAARGTVTISSVAPAA